MEDSDDLLPAIDPAQLDLPARDEAKEQDRALSRKALTCPETSTCSSSRRERLRSQFAAVVLFSLPRTTWCARAPCV